MKTKIVLTIFLCIAIAFSSLSVNANQQVVQNNAQILGDVTDDGLVNASDLLSVRKFIAGTLKKIDYTLGDVNCNSVITTKDVLIYHEYLTGKIKNFDEKYKAELRL